MRRRARPPPLRLGLGVRGGLGPRKRAGAAMPGVGLAAPQIGIGLRLALRTAVYLAAGLIPTGRLEQRGQLETGPADLNLLGIPDEDAGRVRYGLMLRDDGIVFDDGTTWRLSETDFFMTTTTPDAPEELVNCLAGDKLVPCGTHPGSEVGIEKGVYRGVRCYGA